MNQIVNPENQTPGWVGRRVQDERYCLRSSSSRRSASHCFIIDW